MNPYPLVQHLLAHPTYNLYLDQLDTLEKERIYCKHNLSHFLDVARIAVILNQEASLDISEEDLYLAALLHDIGRLGDAAPPHRQESVRLAQPLLKVIGCPDERAAPILEAIALHHYQGKKMPTTFAELLSLADNLSRPCYRCSAAEHCYWPIERKNRFPLR